MSPVGRRNASMESPLTAHMALFLALLMALATSVTLPASVARAQELTAAQSAAGEQTPVQAVLKAQKIDFYFQSFTTFYSCGSLEDKIERILGQLGARTKVQVRSADCPSGVARMPRVAIEAISPVEATAQALAEREKGRSTRELIARVQGKRGEEAPEMEQFLAQWKRISVGSGRLDLDPGDCELVEQLRRKVLPKLAVRILEDDLQCSSHPLSMRQPRLEVEALVAWPKPDEPRSPRSP